MTHFWSYGKIGRESITYSAIRLLGLEELSTEMIDIVVSGAAAGWID